MHEGRKRPAAEATNNGLSAHKQQRIVPRFIPSPELLRVHNQKTSSLLRLPRELRDLIIEEALPSCEGREFRLWYGKGTLPSGLLRTCHQLREETVEVFFKTNTICITGRQNIEDMIDVSRNHHRLMKKVRLVLCERSSYDQAVDVAGYHAIHCTLDPSTVWAPYFGSRRSRRRGGVFGDFVGFVNCAGVTEPYDADRYAKLWDSAHWDGSKSQA